MNNVLAEIRIRPISWIKAAGYAVAMVLVYYSALEQLILHDWGREDYSHCSLIPFVVLFFIWEKRGRLACLPSMHSAWGFLPFLVGIGLYFVGELGGEFFTMYFSLWLVIVGLCWVHLGWEKIKSIGFALVVMLAMFPFPNFVTVRLSLWLQLVSSKLGVWMLQAYGMSAYREGNVIDLGFTQLQVVEACSGLRYVMPMLILSLILAYWFRDLLWKRAVVFLSAIPLAIFMNSFRIAATGILYSMFGPKVAEGFFHGFSGWLLFVLAIPILFGEMWVLKRVLPIKPVEDDVAGQLKGLDSVNGPDSGFCLNDGKSRSDGKGTFSWYYAMAMVILVGTFAASYGVEFREKVPVKMDLSAFPMTIGEWTGVRQTMEEQFVSALHFSEYVMAGYQNPEGREVDYYVAYYESQRKGETTHSPETCLPGSGWIFREAGLAKVPVGDGKSIMVNRTFLEKDGSRQVMYFWFPQRGRILTSLFQVKWYSFWDALTRHRTDGALVRMITPVYPGEKDNDAETRLNGFAGEVAPILNEYLPG